MAVVLVVLAVLAAACSRADRAAPATTAPPEPSTTATTEPPTTTTTMPPPPTYPLTGHPATDPGIAGRAAISVKIDNIAAARPQAGVRAADLVYEEFTEGVTRFVAVYHSNDSDLIGPVRSVRPADPVIVTPYGGVFAFSGGSPGAEALARETPLTVVTESDAAVMYRRPGRAAPHNLYTSTQGLSMRAPPEAGSPPKFAEFLTGERTFGGPGAMPVSKISLVPAPYVTASYEWDASNNAWFRNTDGQPHMTEEGPIAPSTVMVQFTPYKVFVQDQGVQYPEVIGSGDVWVFAAGTLVQGTWSKHTPDAVTTYTDSAGTPIAIPAGQTWIHLVAPGSSVTTE